MMSRLGKIPFLPTWHIFVGVHLSAEMDPRPIKLNFTDNYTRYKASQILVCAIYKLIV